MRFRWAVAVSLAVHACLLWRVALAPVRPHPKPASFVIETEFVDLPPSPPTRPSGTRGGGRPARRSTPQAQVPSEGGVADTSDAPRATSESPSHQLLPSADMFGNGDFPVRGKTLRPGDPSLSAESKAKEEKARVQGRLQGWLEDSIGTAQAENGLAHPYMHALGDAFARELGAAEGGTPKDMGVTSAAQVLMKQLASAAEAYARTGNPGMGPPPLNPTHSEQLAKLSPKGGSGQMAYTMAQISETIESVQRREPLFSVELELRQSRDGAVVGLRMLRGSENVTFDAFATRVVRETVAKVPPPQDAFRKEILRSVWSIEGWFLQPKNEALSMLPGLYGIPLDGIAVEPGALRFDYRARLLRSY